MTFTISAWDYGKIYHYQFEGRSLTGLNQLADQYAGIVLKANVDVAKKSDNTVNIQVKKIIIKIDICSLK